MKFELNGQSVELSDGKCNFWCMHQEFSSYMRGTQNEFEKAYKDMGNLATLSDRYWELIDLIEENGYSTVSILLEKYGDIRLTENEYNELFNHFMNLIDNLFQKYDDEIFEKYRELEKDKNVKIARRKGRKENRRRWYGYGIEGKTKAALRNAGSGMLHSTVNLAGNVTTAIVTGSKMSAAFNDRKRINSMRSDIKIFFDELRKVTYSIMQSNSSKPFELILTTESEEASKKIDALETLEKKSEEHTKVILEALTLDPSLRSIYESIVENYGDKDNKISEFAKKLKINIDEWKVKRLKEQLKKNKESDFSDENKILSAIEKVKEECAFWGIPYNEYTKELDELWSKMNDLLCNVDGKQFETREEAECVKVDMRYLMEYSLKNNILERKIDDVVAEISNNIQSNYYKENLHEKLREIQEQQDLRNIQLATERIISRMPVYSKIQHDFDYGHIFSHKVGYEKLRDLVTDNQKVSFMYATSLFRTGKSGILLTSTHLYFFKNDGIKTIELSEFESIGIKEEKIYVKYNGEEYDTDHEILGLKQNECYFLFETIGQVIKMCLAIKNKDTFIADEEVYNNIIIRSKQVEFLRHNKLEVLAAFGVVILMILCLVNGLSAASKRTQQTVNNNSDVKVENAEQFTGETDIVKEEFSNYESGDSSENFISNTDSYTEEINIDIKFEEGITEKIYYGQSIIDFMYDKDIGWYGNEENSFYFSEILYRLEEGLGINNITSYTIVDMNADEYPEIILELTGQWDTYYLIINYCAATEKTMIFSSGLRGFRDLTEDGVYMGSDGADSWCYCTLDFISSPYVHTEEKIIASANSGYYEIYGEVVDEEQFNQFCEEIYKAGSAVWKNYTEETFMADLSNSVNADITIESVENEKETLNAESIYIPDDMFRDVYFIEYHNISGLYYGIGDSWASISMYTSLEGEEYVGNAEFGGEITLKGELLPLDTNLYQIVTTSGDEILLGMYMDNGIVSGELYINGQYADCFMMVEHYISQ